VKQELAALTKRVDAPPSGKVSTKGKIFQLPDGRTSAGPLVGVILDFVTLNNWYEGQYNPQQRALPACFAIGTDLESLAPSPNAAKPQGSDCASCLRNQWGTGQGGRGKACKNQRRLLLVPGDFTEKSQALTLYVSPSGLKQFDAYLREIVTDHQSRPIDVITSITFDPNQAYPTLKFEFAGKNGNVALAEQLRARNQEVLYREFEAPAKAA
jgi:hypothetical protein